MKVVLGRRGGEATKRRRLWHSRATARVRKRGKTALYARQLTLTRSDPPSDARCSSVPRELIPIRAFHPVCSIQTPLFSTPVRFIVPSERRRVSIVAPRLASRFPNCLETWGRVFCIFESGVWHARRGGKSAARLLGGRGSCASSRAQSSASSSGKKEKRREERKSSARGRVLFFPFYD